MKNKLLTLLTALIFSAATATANDFTKLPESAQKILRRCVELVDKGMTDVAMDDFDALVKEYPDNYTVRYERMYALYMLGRYSEVAESSKKLLKSPDATPLTFQLCGNAFDNLGQADKARKIYRDGLKKFPEAAMLNLELGVIDLKENKLHDALSQFEDGILADPAFASNYYRAAQLYFDSDNTAWGLVYGETEILLAPNNEQRCEEMASQIRDTWKNAISFKGTNDSLTVKVSLVKTHNISIDSKGKQAYIDFPGTLEMCAAIALSTDSLLRPFTGTIAQLSALRKGIVEAYFNMTDNLYGNAMYLLPFQKKVIDAGHWEAYNYFLFSPAAPEEFNQWYEANPKRLEAFIDWFNADPFTLDATHTVSSREIYRDYRQPSLMDALLMQGRLIESTKSK